MSVRIITGDALTELRKLPDESVNCCVTSPPYYGLRDYGTAQWDGGDPACDHKQGRPGAGRADGVVDDRAQRNRDGIGAMGGDCRKCGARRIDRQIGLEPSPDEYVAALVAVFRDVRRVLRTDATCWLNIGDSYSSGGRSYPQVAHGGLSGPASPDQGSRRVPADLPGIKPKDMIGIPWMLAFALRADGWWLRQDIIWSKPNPMPESVTDRCTKAHEYLFLLSKSERYWFDAAAIAELCSWGGGQRVVNVDTPKNRDLGLKPTRGYGHELDGGRNKRSVWTVTSEPFAEAHFATFPPALIEPCILAGCPKSGTVLDPFGGAGTTGLVADRLGRDAILIELNESYAQMAKRRIHGDAPLFADVAMHPPTSECAA